MVIFGVPFFYLNGANMEIDVRELIQASFMLRIDIKVLAKAARKVSVVTEEEYSKMEGTHFTSKTLLNNNYMVRTGDTCLYVVDDSELQPLKPEEIIFALGYAYLIDHPNFDINVASLKNYVINLGNTLSNIRSDEAIIRQYADRIIARRSTLQEPVLFNMSDPVVVFTKACKKLGIKYSYDGKHHFLFKNIKLGNDIEGFIHYKAIEMVYNNGLYLDDVVFSFNKFSYRKSWGIPIIGYMHPHINDSQICFGNRDSDAMLYRKTGAYEFFALLLKESINNYNPGSPYEKVTTIINKVMVLEKICNMYKALDSNGELITKDSNPEEYAKLMFSHIRKCRVCNHFILPNPEHPDQDGVCTNESCTANPNATIECPECSRPMTRGVWDDNWSRYRWECHNVECSNSVEYREQEKRREERLRKIQALINSHFTEIDFTGKKGYVRKVVLLDNEYIPCPICGEPLSLSRGVIYCNAPNTAHRTHAFYLTGDSREDIYTELINSENCITELPESAKLLAVRPDKTIVGRILTKLWLKSKPLKENGMLYKPIDIVAFGKNEAYINDEMVNPVFNFSDVYADSLRNGLPRNIYLDMYFESCNIPIVV